MRGEIPKLSCITGTRASEMQRYFIGNIVQAFKVIKFHEDEGSSGRCTKQISLLVMYEQPPIDGTETSSKAIVNSPIKSLYSIGHCLVA